jgi:hypothetical protein
VNRTFVGKLKEMNKRRHLLTFTSIAITSLLLFNFQNCAPAGSSMGVGTGTTGDARIVDDFNKAEIQFVSDDVQVHDEAVKTDIDGLCNRSHNNAKLKWAIYDGENQLRPIAVGESQCGRGQFAVILTDLPDIECGIKHLLVVEGEWGASTFTHLSRRCQPQAMEEIEAPQDSPIGTTCAVEYQSTAISGSNCTQVCYRGDKVVMTQKVDNSMCSNIAPKVAGP